MKRMYVLQLVHTLRTRDLMHSCIRFVPINKIGGFNMLRNIKDMYGKIKVKVIILYYVGFTWGYAHLKYFKTTYDLLRILKWIRDFKS